MKKTAALMTVLVLLAAIFCCGAVGEQAVKIDAVRELAWPYYADAVGVAKNSPGYGRDFTDHKTAHAEMVAVKAVEAGRAIEEAARRGTLPTEATAGSVPFSPEIDYSTLEGAALFHDTGMSGNGYAPSEKKDIHEETVKDENGKAVLEERPDGLYLMYEEDNLDFAEIRANHSLNSGLYVLVNRDGLREAGYTDVQIDKMAAACMAHSKSNSGVRNLNSRTDWGECFKRLESAVAAWNEHHDYHQISFDRTPFETDDALLASLVSETLALRIGDVSRDSGPDAEVQTGETVHVERDTLNDRGGSIPMEVADAVIYIAETRESVQSEKSRQVHAGEQNIIENHTFLDEDGAVIHDITVQDGCSAPRCTQQAVDDHLGEFYSARDGSFTIRVKFIRFEDEDGFFMDSWETFRIQAAQEYPNLTIRYPWDEEGDA